MSIRVNIGTERTIKLESIPLEDRLIEFVEWLLEQNIWLECGAGPLHKKTVRKLVHEYVES